MKSWPGVTIDLICIPKVEYLREILGASESFAIDMMERNKRVISNFRVSCFQEWPILESINSRWAYTERVADVNVSL